MTPLQVALTVTLAASAYFSMRWLTSPMQVLVATSLLGLPVALLTKSSIASRSVIYSLVGMILGIAILTVIMLVFYGRPDPLDETTHLITFAGDGEEMFLAFAPYAAIVGCICGSLPSAIWPSHQH